MDQGPQRDTKNNGPTRKEVFKDLSIVSSQRTGSRAGRNSPESGSLYSDYESGQQYEDKDLAGPPPYSRPPSMAGQCFHHQQELPSGYNSGEQYDTMSTGYMSGEAYELPLAREPTMESKLSSIEEITLSNRSHDDLFKLPHAQSENNILVQTDVMESSSTSSIHETDEQLLPMGDTVLAHKMKRKKKDFQVLIPENTILLQNENMESSSSSSLAKNMDPLTGLDPLTLHKHKLAKKLNKKSVSYHVSVPIEKSPPGQEMKAKVPRTMLRECPSDTDTTSCFDSDGTYMRSECQSSDSGAMLLSTRKSKRNRSRDRDADEAGIIRGSRKRITKKAKHIMRNSSDFFDRYDNKYWGWARSICFWFSTLSTIGSILGCVIMIILMPKTCDPVVQWWQGKLTLDIIPRNGTDGRQSVDIAQIIHYIPTYKQIGVQTLKLKHFYLKTPDSGLNLTEASSWLPLSTDVVQTWIQQPGLLPDLSKVLHKHDMTLMVEIPAIQENSTGRMSYNLERAIMTAIVFWAELGVDGISIVGLENYSEDPNLIKNIKTWKGKFEQYGNSPNIKILSGPSSLPRIIEEMSPAEEGEELSPAFTSIQNFGLLDAAVNLEEVRIDLKNSTFGESLANITKWDFAPSQPWIHWAVEGEREELTNAELALLMFLPGSVSLQEMPLHQEELVRRFTSFRAKAVPVFMNGNYKTCHGHCTQYKEKEVNHLVHVKENGLVLIERHFSRRNRYMVIANMRSENVSLSSISSIYSGGDLILDTSNLEVDGSYVDFKDAELSGMQANVIKFPK